MQQALARLHAGLMQSPPCELHASSMQPSCAHDACALIVPITSSFLPAVGTHLLVVCIAGIAVQRPLPTPPPIGESAVGG